MTCSDKSYGGVVKCTPMPEAEKRFVECTDETCTTCGKPKSGVQWRLSSIAKGKPLPEKGFTYLHIKIKTKLGSVMTFKTVPTKQETAFYEQVATLMYNEAVEKYT